MRHGRRSDKNLNSSVGSHETSTCNAVFKINKRSFEKMSSKKVILCGFSSVSWQNNEGDDDSSEHRDSTKAKGQKLAEADHVFDVKEIRENGRVEIVGFCVRETSVREKPYKITLELDDNRKILDARCQCVAGLNGDCKHTAALIFFINNEREESQTDRKCTWRAPSQYGQKLYPKGQTFDEIFGFNQPKARFNAPSEEDQNSHLKLLQKYGDANSLMFHMLSAKVNCYLIFC